MGAILMLGMEAGVQPYQGKGQKLAYHKFFFSSDFVHFILEITKKLFLADAIAPNASRYNQSSVEGDLSAYVRLSIASTESDIAFSFKVVPPPPPLGLKFVGMAVASIDPPPPTPPPPTHPASTALWAKKNCKCHQTLWAKGNIGGQI